jgi:predicted Holliday junction resolvase-like endonuclease
MESKRREMCEAIKYLLVMKVVKEAEESGRERAVREAIEKARGVIDKLNSI